MLLVPSVGQRVQDETHSICTVFQPWRFSLSLYHTDTLGFSPGGLVVVREVLRPSEHAAEEDECLAASQV